MTDICQKKEIQFVLLFSHRNNNHLRNHNL